MSSPGGAEPLEPLAAGVTGRAVIVTGAASGVGKAMAEALARANASVVLVDRDAAGLERTCAGLDDPSRHLALRSDLADVDALGGIVHATVARFDDLWALVHAAAVLRRQPLDEVTEADWDLQHAVNLKASFFLNRVVGAELVRRGGGGRIVNFASGAFLTGAVFGSDAYVASKGGVVSMTRSFAKAYGPHGVLVNCIAPGQVDTPMQHVDNPRSVVEAAIDACPLRRMGQPHEVAAVALFLLSTHASFVTGATINVSGGSFLY